MGIITESRNNAIEFKSMVQQAVKKIKEQNYTNDYLIKQLKINQSYLEREQKKGFECKSIIITNMAIEIVLNENKQHQLI